MKRFLSSLIPLAIVCATVIWAFALDAKAAAAPVKTGALNVWKDGVSVITALRGNVTEVTLTAPESEREYFYPYIYRYGEYNLSEYGAYAYRVNNAGQAPLRINFALTDLAGTDYRIEDTGSAVVIRDGDPTPERIFPSFGLFELEPGFRGEIRIPLDRVPRASLQNIVSYGVTAAVPGGSSVSFEISGAEWRLGLGNIPDFRLKGPGKLRIPAAGEAAARYSVDFGESEKRFDAIFSLEGEPEDVSITRDGILTVGGGAKAGDVKISVSVGGLVKGGLSLSLIEKRRDFPFPESADTAKLSGENDPFFDERVLNGLRIALIVIALYPAGLYLLWKTAERGNGES